MDVVGNKNYYLSAFIPMLGTSVERSEQTSYTYIIISSSQIILPIDLELHLVFYPFGFQL